MEIDIRQKRIEAFRAANESIKSLYGSMELAEILGQTSKKFGLDKNRHDTFINLIGDTILGLISKVAAEDELVKQLGIDPQSAQDSMREIKNFIAQFDARFQIPDAESALKEKLELRPEGVPVVEQMTQPLTREELLNALSAKRTMASDMARVQGAPAAGAPTVGYQNYKPPTESTPGQ